MSQRGRIDRRLLPGATGGGLGEGESRHRTGSGDAGAAEPTNLPVVLIQEATKILVQKKDVHDN